MLLIKMCSMGYSKAIFEGLICIAILPLLFTVCMGGELSETESFFNFIRAVDSQNVLRIDWIDGNLPNPCLSNFKGVKCSLLGTNIVGIRLENMNLSGTIDAESLCKLRYLRVVSLAKNLIQGEIPISISNCRRLKYLNLSNNHLSGTVPLALTKLKHLRSLDISNNHFPSTVSDHFKQEIKCFDKYLFETSSPEMSRTSTVEIDMAPSSDDNTPENGGDDNTPENGEKSHWFKNWMAFVPLILGVSLVILVAYCLGKRTTKISRDKEILKAIQDSPSKTLPVVDKEEVKPEERQSELVFFVDEHEMFKLDDLLEATADLQSQTSCSSLFMVRLKNNIFYAVKRLKKLQVPFDEFSKTMRQIGNLKHPNILPLVCYNSSNEEKLLIYKYQSNGSLLSLLEAYIRGKRDFPWKLRLSITMGIAKGLDFIYQMADEEKTIPHGNLKLSNILLDENENPLISEYGYSKFLDLRKTSLLSSSGYVAPEKNLSEQGDVFSFGVILLELLTGKAVEKTGIDLPKWVRAMVREEWTGEVFDKEVARAGKQWAFPLLNVGLKCVSKFPDDRPTMAEVLERIEEVVNGNDDHNHEPSISSFSSMESFPHDSSLLHTVIQENPDTPGSNY